MRHQLPDFTRRLRGLACEDALQVGIRIIAIGFGRLDWAHKRCGERGLRSAETPEGF